MGQSHSASSPGKPAKNWVAILALITSVGSLAVSAASAYLSRYYYDAVITYYKLSVKPYVGVYASLAGPGGKNGFYVANHGLGPAFVKKLYVEGGGRTYDGFNKSLWQNVVKDLNSWKNYNLSLTCYREIFVQPDSIIRHFQYLLCGIVPRSVL
jgi:hypothetical protein